MARAKSFKASSNASARAKARPRAASAAGELGLSSTAVLKSLSAEGALPASRYAWPRSENRSALRGSKAMARLKSSIASS